METAYAVYHILVNDDKTTEMEMHLFVSLKSAEEFCKDNPGYFKIWKKEIKK